MPSPRSSKTSRVFRPANLVANTLAILIGTAIAQQCRAASDCDVKIIKVNSVKIEDDRITINAEASIGMVIITPELPKDGKSRRFTGRHSTWIRIKADEATFTVLRPGPKLNNKAWTEMSIQAAKDLKAGKEIGRIGYYRPDITIEKNQVRAITGKGYIYRKREEAKPAAAKNDVVKPVDEDTKDAASQSANTKAN